MFYLLLICWEVVAGWLTRWTVSPVAKVWLLKVWLEEGLFQFIWVNTAADSPSCCWLLLIYIVLFSTLELVSWALVAGDFKWVTIFLQRIVLISTQVVYLQHCLVVTWFVPRKTANTLARSVYTVSGHFMQIHVHREHECSAVTCHLHFWQNDPDLYMLLW